VTGRGAAAGAPAAGPRDYPGAPPGGGPRRPPPSALRPARVAVALCGTLLLFAVYLAARRATGLRWAPLAAPALLFLTPAFQFHATHVYTDVVQMLLVVCSFLAVAPGLAAGPRAWAWLGAGLALSGLACATKYSSGALVAAFAVALAAVRPGTARARLLRLLACLLVPAAFFVAVNPFLWPDPAGRTLWAASTWSGFGAEQQASAELARFAVTGRAEALLLVLSRSVLDPFQGGEIRGWATSWLQEHWAIPLGLALLAAGAALALFRVRLGPGARRRAAAARAGVAAATALGLAAPGAAGIGGALAGLGLWEGARQARVQGRASAPAFFAVVFATGVIATAAWLPMDWARYYLPAQIWSPLLQVAALGWLASLATAERRRGGGSGAGSEPLSNPS